MTLRQRNDAECPLCLDSRKINPIQDNPKGEVDPCPNCAAEAATPGLRAYRRWKSSR